jgi:hypothetical protein
MRAGWSLDDLAVRFSWVDLKALVEFPAQGSALRLALNPDAWVTPEVDLLRLVMDDTRWLVWSKSRDAQQGGRPPGRTFLTASERRAALPAEYRFDAVPLDRFDAELAARRAA